MATKVWFRCRGCGAKILALFESDEDEYPDCPHCAAEQGPRQNLDFDKPITIGFGGSPTDRAVKITQQIAEQDYGLTNFRGSAGGDAVTHHLGEPGIPPLTPIQQTMKDAWDKSQGGHVTLPTPGGGGALINAARAATEAERARDRVNGTKSPVHAALGAIRRTPQVGTILARADSAGNILKARR